MTKQEVLQQCVIEGNIVKLPDVQLDRNEYLEVKKNLELIGGKWKGGKVYGFVFAQNPAELLAQIANGENRNLKKEYQFFATPASLADELVELAKVKLTDDVLEPSAGQGAIVEAILRARPCVTVFGYELMPTNQVFLNKIIEFKLLGDDFFKGDTDISFNKIIANPPFSKNQDIEHIYEMFSRLNLGGRLVSIASTHWRESKNKKETQFREWLAEVNATIIDIEPGTFKESGTMVPGVIIVIDK